jgi:hypothetical protein
VRAKKQLSFLKAPLSKAFRPLKKGKEISMSDIETDLEPKLIKDLAAELAVDVEALEERLEMVSIDAFACCVINGFGCRIPTPGL